jgi:hypothetical protein
MEGATVIDTRGVASVGHLSQIADTAVMDTMGRLFQQGFPQEICPGCHPIDPRLRVVVEPRAESLRSGGA